MDDRVAPEPTRLIEQQLTPGERVLWSAQPAPASRAVAVWKRAVLGVMLLALAGTTTYTDAAYALEAPVRWISYICDVVYVGIALIITFVPLWEWWVARRTVYLVTQYRALIIERYLFRVEVSEYHGAQLLWGERRTDSLGRGAIVFDRVTDLSATGRPVTIEFGFFGLDDLPAVDALLRTTTALPS